MLNNINNQDIKLTNDSALRKLIKFWIEKSIHYIYIFIIVKLTNCIYMHIMYKLSVG